MPTGAEADGRHARARGPASTAGPPPGKPLAWVDVTLPLAAGMVVYEGDPPVEVVPALALAHGDHANVSRLTLGSHTGTHVDAPRHFIPDGQTVDRLALDTLLGPVRVVGCPPGPIEPGALARVDLSSERRLILKTGNSALWDRGRFVRDYQALTLATARVLAEARIGLVGIDYLSVESFRAPGFPVHRCLLEAGIVVLEGLDLSAVEAGRYELCCLPLRIRDGDGAPARVLLRALPG
jgi:arylformamidase